MYPTPSQARDLCGVNKQGQGCLVLIRGYREGKLIFPAIPHPPYPRFKQSGWLSTCGTEGTILPNWFGFGQCHFARVPKLVLFLLCPS